MQDNIPENVKYCSIISGLHSYIVSADKEALRQSTTNKIDLIIPEKIKGNEDRAAVMFALTCANFIQDLDKESKILSLAKSDQETWQFCQSISHGELEANTATLEGLFPYLFTLGVMAGVRDFAGGFKELGGVR